MRLRRRARSRPTILTTLAAIARPSSRPIRRAQEVEQRRRSGDVDERRRQRQPPHPEVVEGEVEQRVQEQVREGDDRGQPVRLQAEERPVQQQHRAVEHEAGAERGQRARDDGGLARVEVAALEEDADDRLSQRGADDRGGREQEDDLAQTARHLRPEAGRVAAGGEAGERREEHGRDRDGEHPLREHVDEERLLNRVRREIAVDQARCEEGVDHRVDVDQAEAERDRDHHLERPARRPGRASRSGREAGCRRGRGCAATASAGTPG